MTERTKQPGSIEVTGAGTVEVAPDEAIVRFDVISDAKTAAEATAASARQTQAVVEAVSAQPNHGVGTGGLAVRPLISHDPKTGVGTITGFRATNSVNVTTKVGYAGEIFDAGIRAGANQSSGISFRVQDEQQHRQEALRRAVRNAFAQAAVVAEAAAVAIGGLELLQVEPTGGPMLYRAESLRSSAPATPVIADDLSFAASVRAVFRVA